MDSGAVVSLLRRSVADLLGLDLATGRKIDLTGVGGASTIAYVHNLQSRFDGSLTLEVPFAIADSETVPNLLGRLGVFDRLQMDFDSSLSQTTVGPPWLDENDVRVYRLLLATEEHILGRWPELGLPAPADTVVARFITRQSQLLAAVYGLMKLGRAYGTIPLLRAMLEVWLQFEYLMRDPAKRAQQYLDYTHIAKYRSAEAIVTDPRGAISKALAASPKRATGMKRLKAEFDRVRPSFTTRDRKGKERLSQNWYGMKVADLARELDQLPEYRMWYVQGSAWAHGDPSSTEHPLPYSGQENKVADRVATCYYARMLLRMSDKMVLTADQYELLKELATDTS
jgi:hypothetical protein